MSHQQYVVVPSNSSMEYFPDNTLASFRVKLGKPLILQGQYDVALTEIIYPHRRLTVQPLEATMTVESTRKKSRKKPPAPQIWDVVDDRIDKLRSKKGKEPKIVKSKVALNAEAVASNEIPRDKRSSGAVSRYTLPAGTYDTAGDLFKALHTLTYNSGVFFNMDHGTGMFRVDVKANIGSANPRTTNQRSYTVLM